MQGHDAFQLVCQIGAVFRLAFGKRVQRRQMRVRQMVDAVQKAAEHFAVVDNPPHRNAAKVHPVIAALAPDQPRSCAFAPGAVIGNRQFQRGFNGF